jgi:hypothetical protein
MLCTNAEINATVSVAYTFTTLKLQHRRMVYGTRRSSMDSVAQVCAAQSGPQQDGSHTYAEMA